MSGPGPGGLLVPLDAQGVARIFHYQLPRANLPEPLLRKVT